MSDKGRLGLPPGKMSLEMGERSPAALRDTSIAGGESGT